jgi:hypothetical protein
MTRNKSLMNFFESLLDSSSQLDTRGLLTWGCLADHPHGPTGFYRDYGPNTESVSRRKDDRVKDSQGDSNLPYEIE